MPAQLNKSPTHIHGSERASSKLNPTQVGTRRRPRELRAPSDAAVMDEPPDSMETLQELEREIGIADWIDPQTGEPAEGQSPPHLDEE